MPRISFQLFFLFVIFFSGLSLPSNLQTVSLAFPLRDSQKKRILLPKPTASSNVVSIPLSSIISQTIGVPQGVHSKSRDTPVSAEHTPDGNREKEMKTKKNRERSFPCLRCSTKTTTRQALWKHKRRFHSHEPQEGKTAERVSCDECDAFWYVSILYTTQTSKLYIKVLHTAYFLHNTCTF